MPLAEPVKAFQGPFEEPPFSDHLCVQLFILLLELLGLVSIDILRSLGSVKLFFLAPQLIIQTFNVLL